MSVPMKRFCQGLTSMLTVLVFSSLALGHVTVAPTEAEAGAEVLYTARVPTETSSPTVRVEIQFPGALSVSRFEAKPGWTASLERNEAGTIVSATIEGGSIPPRESAEFSFLAQNPGEAARLVWQIRQVYADGTSSDWTPATSVTSGD